MGRLGADPDELRRLGAELARAAATLDGVRSRTGRALRAAPWSGPDAAAARSDWDRRDGPVLAVVAAGCRRLSHRVALRADDQVRTSSAGAPGGRAGGAAGGAGPPGAGRVEELLGPIPRATTEVHGEVEVSGAVVTASIATGVTVEELPGGRRAVTATSSPAVGAGADATTGWRADVDGLGAGGGAGLGGTVEAAIAERRRWEVPAGDVPLLLSQIGLEEATRHHPVGSVFGELRRRVGPDHLVDRPVAVERLVGLGAGATAWGQAGAPGAAGWATTEVRAGHLDGRDGDAVVLEYTGATTGGVTRALAALAAPTGVELPTSPGGSVDARLVARTSGPDAGQVRLVAEVGSGGRVQRVEAVLPPDRGRAAPDLSRAAGRLATGDLPGAVGALGSSIAEGRGIAVRVSEGVVQGRSAVAEGGSGPGFGVTGHATTTSWRTLATAWHPPRRAP